MVAFARADRRRPAIVRGGEQSAGFPRPAAEQAILLLNVAAVGRRTNARHCRDPVIVGLQQDVDDPGDSVGAVNRSEEHTSELQSLMRISYAVFCLKKKKNIEK